MVGRVAVEQVDEHAAGDLGERVTLEEVADDIVEIDRCAVRVDLAGHADAAADVLSDVDVRALWHRVLDVRVLNLDLLEAEVDLVFSDEILDHLANVVGDPDAVAVVVIRAGVRHLVVGSRKYRDAVAKVRAPGGIGTTRSMIVRAVGVDGLLAGPFVG